MQNVCVCVCVGGGGGGVMTGACWASTSPDALVALDLMGGDHVKKLWTSMHNSTYNCDFKNLITPLNSLGTLEIYHVIKTAN